MAICRYQTHDEQLHKDIEGVLELSANSLSLYAKQQHSQEQQRPLQQKWLTAMLELFDGVCWLLKGRAKPAHWVTCVVKAAKLYSGPERGQAAQAAQVRPS